MQGSIAARVLTFQNTQVKLATAARCNDLDTIYDCCVDLVSLISVLKSKYFEHVKCCNFFLVFDIF